MTAPNEVLIAPAYSGRHRQEGGWVFHFARVGEHWYVQHVTLVGVPDYVDSITLTEFGGNAILPEPFPYDECHRWPTLAANTLWRTLTAIEEGTPDA